MKLVRGAEMRYLGQLRDIVIFLPENRRGEPFTDQTLKDLISGIPRKTPGDLRVVRPGHGGGHLDAEGQGDRREASG